MKVLKFGGKSLANGKPLENVIEIIKNESSTSEVSLVVSARGKSTDQLLSLYHKALNLEDYHTELAEFIAFQEFDLSDYRDELEAILGALQLLKVDSDKTRDKVLSYGEIISALKVTDLLKKEGLNAVFVDARELIKTDSSLNEVNVDIPVSESNTKAYFENLPQGTIPVITGFLASDPEGNTITLGRNGSNFTATLIASFIEAEEVQNWTDIDGIYSASPKYVQNANKISHLTYKEANELANFGANILHAKTIIPLIEKKIPLKICNSLAPNQEGTTIDQNGSGKGIKAVSTIEDVSLVSIEGRGLLGKIGIDARIFSALSQNNVSVRLISQASSERSIGFVINQEDAVITKRVLEHEFKSEIANNDISKIDINNEMAIVAIIGKHNYSLEKAIRGLRRNKIWLHLISNSISGANMSLVVDRKCLRKAVNVVHNHVFGAIKSLNLFAFGKGNVGGKLLDQIIETGEDLVKSRGLEIKVIGVSDSKRMIFAENGLTSNWKTELSKSSQPNDFDLIISYLNDSGLENIVVVDNTSSQELTDCYPIIIENGFDLVASNKKGNSSSYTFYEDLRKQLKRRERLFYYETNVGAGLPLIDTIKHLHNSSDKIERIRGVFSGSLSYIFNNYSVTEKSFSSILAVAREKGLTEPDAREDLSGMDVARKLIILAREAGLKVEFEEVKVESLIPDELVTIDSYSDFLKKSDVLDAHFDRLKSDLQKNEVLRYVGELEVATNSLTVSLVKATNDSPLGNIKNADSIFEIYTEGYGEQPIIIQGAGAGSEVTARGVYSDLLRIGSQY